MQKVINVIALLSGLTSLSLIGGGAYLLLNKDALIDKAKGQAAEMVTDAVTTALPILIDKAIPGNLTGGPVVAPKSAPVKVPGL